MADTGEGFDGSTDDLIAEIHKMEKEKEELEKKNRERQQLEQRLKQLKGNVSSLKSTPAKKSTSERQSSESSLNVSLEESQARLRSLQQSLLLGSPGTSTSIHDDDEPRRSKSNDDYDEDDVMTSQHKKALRENRDILVENMTPDDIFNDLISKHILSNADVSRIKEKNTVEAINEELLNILVRRSDRAFLVFVASLRRTLQGWLANKLDPTHSVESRGARKRKTGELNVDVECERVAPQSKKRFTCTCREVEEQILIMAKVAFVHIRRRDGTSQSFEQFKKELHQTNEALKDSMEILHSLKVLCRHGDLSDLSNGSVRFTIRCTSFASCQRLWKAYKSGEILQAFERGILTPSLLKSCSAKKIWLRVKVSKLEYLTCALELAEELRKMTKLRDITITKRHHKGLRAKLEQKGARDKVVLPPYDIDVDENHPLELNPVVDKISTPCCQRVFRTISPNVMPLNKCPYKQHKNVPSGSSFSMISMPLNKDIDKHFNYCNNQGNSKCQPKTFVENIDWSRIFPFSTGDIHEAWQGSMVQHSPVYRLRSKEFTNNVTVESKPKPRGIISKTEKQSISSAYNLRYRPIRT